MKCGCTFLSFCLIVCFCDDPSSNVVFPSQFLHFRASTENDFLMSTIDIEDEFPGKLGSMTLQSSSVVRSINGGIDKWDDCKHLIIMYCFTLDGEYQIWSIEGADHVLSFDAFDRRIGDVQYATKQEVSKSMDEGKLVHVLLIVRCDNFEWGLLIPCY